MDGEKKSGCPVQVQKMAKNTERIWETASTREL
jgi:hypothetical protein